MSDNEGYCFAKNAWIDAMSMLETQMKTVR